MKDRIHTLIVDAISVDGTLTEPFSAHDIRRICPGWGLPRYYSYLAENCSENQPEVIALYLRVGCGKYALNKQARQNTIK